MTFGCLARDSSIFRPIEAEGSLCYARGMARTWRVSNIWQRTSQPAEVRRERGWKVWLAPRPFTLVSSATHLAAILYVLQGDCEGCRPLWRGVLAVVALLGLLLLDRLDYRLYGETPPRVAGFVFLGLRLALTMAVAGIFGYGGWTYSIFLFVLLPYVALFYFGLKGTMLTGALVWVVASGMMVVALIPHMSVVTVVQRGQTWSYQILTGAVVNEYIGWVALYTIPLVFVLTSARVAHREKEHAARARQLLVRLEDSHALLNHYAQTTIAETEQRNRAASEMHDRLGHHLAAVSIQLEKALAFRDVDLPAVERALRSAKQMVSRALADVRRSVASLRERKGAVVEPERGLPEPVEYRAEHAGAAGRPGGWKRLVHWLAPRTFDPVATTFYAGILLLDVSWLQSGGTERVAGVVALVALLIVLDRLEYAVFGERPPVRAGSLLLAIRLGIVMVLFFGLGLWVAIMLFAFLPYLCFIYLGDRAGYAAGLSVLLAFGVMGLLAGLGDAGSRPIDSVLAEYIQTLLTAAFMLAVLAATARAVGKEREGRVRAEQLLAELGEAHIQLATASRQVVAAVQARNSLARDIHDGLGHYLTATSLQIEKALAFRTLDPPSADQAIVDSKRMVSEALHEVRSTIGALKETQEVPPLAQLLDELVLRASHRGLAISLHIQGDEQGYSRQAIATLYRAAQEGITNVQKHARARQAKLDLRLGEHTATLEIEDDGQGFASGVPAQTPPAEASDRSRKRGYGLQSMAERLELVGGSLNIDSDGEHGTRLHISVPRLQGTHAEPTRP